MVWARAPLITARLTEKGTDDGKRFEYEAWFRDTYLRTASGWRYALASSSLPLPKRPRETNNCIVFAQSSEPQPHGGRFRPVRGAFGARPCEDIYRTNWAARSTWQRQRCAESSRHFNIEIFV